MSFKEKNFTQPTRHNPYLHQKCLDVLGGMKPGRILDIPSGPGYLLQDFKAKGFDGVAAELDDELHCLPDIEYQKVDMTKRFPFADKSFDYVLSVEGIEHIENHFAFLSEVKRVLKPGGYFFLTTPNILDLSSRWSFFISGFHHLAAKPIPLDTENMYFEHINPIGLNQLYFYCEKLGLSFEKVLTHRYRTGATILYWLFYPIIMFGIYSACFIREKKPSRRESNRKIYSFLKSKANLLGSHTIILAKSN